MLIVAGAACIVERCYVLGMHAHRVARGGRHKIRRNERRTGCAGLAVAAITTAGFEDTIDMQTGVIKGGTRCVYIIVTSLTISGALPGMGAYG